MSDISAITRLSRLHYLPFTGQPEIGERVTLVMLEIGQIEANVELCGTL